MVGSVPLPLIGPFVPCPVSAIGHCVGLITAPYTGLPIPLVTNLWHATCSSLCVLLVVYERTFDVFDMSVFVCVRSHVCAKPPGQAFSLFLFVVWLLIRGHLIPWSPSEGLVDAAISTQHCPQATWKTFYPALCSLFLIKILHSPASQAKLPHLYLFHDKPASLQHTIVISFFVLLFQFFFKLSAIFFFTFRFIFCSEKCQGTLMKPTHAHIVRPHTHFIGIFHKKEKNWHEK